MKKLFFTLAIMVGAVTASNAQEVGQMWTGGSVGIWHESIKDGDDFTSFKILPEFGYVITDNLGVGISLGYLHNEGRYDQLGNIESRSTDANGFTVNPFVRYSFLKGDLGSLFVDGGVGYAYLKDKANNNQKINNLEVGFRPGVAVRVSDKVSLSGKFGFLGYQYEKRGGIKMNSFGLDLDMNQFQFGVNIAF